MFEHLDDPSPPSAGERTLASTLAVAKRIRRRRMASVLAIAGAGCIVIGVVVGVEVNRSPPTKTFAAFDSQTGLLAPGTSVPLEDLADTVFFDDFHGYAIALHGQQTLLAASSDAGATWKVVDNSLPTSSMAQLEFSDAEHGYLWGGSPSSDGTVPLWVSASGGKSWTKSPLGPVVSDVSAIGSDVWAIVGTCPVGSSVPAASCTVRVEVSSDGGDSWQATQSSPPVVAQPGLSVADQDLELARITQSRAYLLSYGQANPGSQPDGDLAYTADGGRSWLTRPDPCGAYFDFGEQIAASGTEDLWMICASQASAGSQAKALYRSSNGGQSWALAAAANAPALSANVTVPAAGGLPLAGYVSPYSLGHENLAVLSPTTAWLFPDRSAVFETTNGGLNWSPVSELTREGFVSGGDGNVVFADTTHGWVHEDGTGLWHTTDAGGWEQVGS
jgi:photosystem II stability/assembly factor-like uncharacterized protein